MGILIYRDQNMLDRRVTYKRRSSYRTKSNRFKTVKTPGGKLAIQYIKKKTNGRAMRGIKVARPSQLKRMSVRSRTISRPYGGNLTHMEVRDRITRAFMIEEINSIKQKATASDGSKKKKRGAKKSKK